MDSFSRSLRNNNSSKSQKSNISIQQKKKCDQLKKSFTARSFQDNKQGLQLLNRQNTSEASNRNCSPFPVKKVIPNAPKISPPLSEKTNFLEVRQSCAPIGFAKLEEIDIQKKENTQICPKLGLDDSLILKKLHEIRQQRKSHHTNNLIERQNQAKADCQKLKELIEVKNSIVQNNNRNTNELYRCKTQQLMDQDTILSSNSVQSPFLIDTKPDPVIRTPSERLEFYKQLQRIQSISSTFRDVKIYLETKAKALLTQNSIDQLQAELLKTCQDLAQDKKNDLLRKMPFIIEPKEISTASQLFTDE